MCIYQICQSLARQPVMLHRVCVLTSNILFSVCAVLVVEQLNNNASKPSAGATQADLGNAYTETEAQRFLLLVQKPVRSSYFLTTMLLDRIRHRRCERLEHHDNVAKISHAVSVYISAIARSGEAATPTQP